MRVTTRKSFDQNGKFIDELAELAPGQSAHGWQSSRNGGRLLTPLALPDFCDFALEISCPGQASRKLRASWAIPLLRSSA